MNDATAAALNRINRQFYHLYSDPFSATRSRPWRGWKRLVEHFSSDWPPQADPGGVMSILDVGCGNGRFGVFLSQHLPIRIHYFGVDSSAELLAVATQRLAAASQVDAELLELDLLSGDRASAWNGHTFHLIVVFGLLHHLPGIENRRQLLTELAARLVPGGMLALSFWQFASVERFQRRIIPWAEHNRVTGEAIDIHELERGDYLLAWGDRGSARRYCHFGDPQEARELVKCLDLDEVEHFRADGGSGELNLYYLLQAGR